MDFWKKWVEVGGWVGEWLRFGVGRRWLMLGWKG